jgi:hypothetical protein
MFLRWHVNKQVDVVGRTKCLLAKVQLSNFFYKESMQTGPSMQLV